MRMWFIDREITVVARWCRRTNPTIGVAQNHECSFNRRCRLMQRQRCNKAATPTV
jgi:hypothetical protein